MGNLYFSNDCVQGLRLWTGGFGPRLSENGDWVLAAGCIHVAMLSRHQFPAITDELEQGRCVRVEMGEGIYEWRGREAATA